MLESLVEDVLKKVSTGQLSVVKAADLLLTEMGRGGRILVVDENLLGLEMELSALGYVTYTVATRGQVDEMIRPQLRSRVFITRNGKDFVEGLTKHHFGLVWIVSRMSNRDLAKKIAKVLMKSNFHRKPVQVVKV